MTEKGRLLVCATPIGNLGDITERLKAALAEADVIYAEDTRRTAKLLSHLGLRTRVKSLFVGNEKKRTAELIEELVQGANVVLVSDAGMPTVSDPGAVTIREARQAGAEVSVLPGPSAVTTAVTLAGFGADRFVFEGFLPRRGRERRTRIERLAFEDRPVVLFASPSRLQDDLADLAQVLDSRREVAVMREMTKLHEEVWIGSLEAAVARWSGESARGEITVVLSPALESPISLEDAVIEARALMDAGQSASAAARSTAESTGVSRRSIYQALLGQDRS